MKSIHTWLDEYGVSHQNSTNKLIHWICVPAIFFSIVGLSYCVKLNFNYAEVPFTLAHVITLLVVVYYVFLSPALAIGISVFILICLTICGFIESVFSHPWLVYVIIFVLAWIGQFIGHNIEGKKPSFLKDLQFLLIGPAWLMSFIYKKLGIKI